MIRYGKWLSKVVGKKFIAQCLLALVFTGTGAAQRGATYTNPVPPRLCRDHGGIRSNPMNPFGLVPGLLPLWMSGTVRDVAIRFPRFSSGGAE